MGSFSRRPLGGLFALLLAVFGLAGCALQPSPSHRAEAWPEADRLFRQDTRWVGADDAFSIDLGNGRTLWLFGDTLVDPTGRGERASARMVRNSIAIQRGDDPSRARIAFFGGGRPGGTAGRFLYG